MKGGMALHIDPQQHAVDMVTFQHIRVKGLTLQTMLRMT